MSESTLGSSALASRDLCGPYVPSGAPAAAYCCCGGGTAAAAVAWWACLPADEFPATAEPLAMLLSTLGSSLFRTSKRCGPAMFGAGPGSTPLCGPLADVRPAFGPVAVV